MWNRIGKINIEQRGAYKNGFLTNVPMLIDEETIRLFVGFWDEYGVSRIGSIEVVAKNPSEILNISGILLDTGRGGCFDDNGLVLGDIVKESDHLKMYYVGFQKAIKAKFLAFSGLAISRDNGASWLKHSSAPVFDRTNGADFINAIHTVIKDNGIYKIWYSSGNDWKIINNTPYPCYDIWYTESLDGINIKPGRKIIENSEGEYRIGRPTVYKISSNEYHMYTTYDTITKDYRTSFFLSKDGINWNRRDDLFDFKPSGITGEFDSDTICYPKIIKTKYNTYMFYSGNKMGSTGIGYAVKTI